jgi:hypothetical protein
MDVEEINIRALWGKSKEMIYLTGIISKKTLAEKLPLIKKGVDL